MSVAAVQIDIRADGFLALAREADRVGLMLTLLAVNHECARWGLAADGEDDE